MSTILFAAVLYCVTSTGLALIIFVQSRRFRKKINVLGEMSAAQSTILENAQFAIAMSEDRKIVWANPYFTSMLGWTPDDYLGQSTQLIYPDENAYLHMWTIIRPSIEGGERSDTEMQLRHKNGNLVDARVIGRAVNPEVPSEGAIWLLEDISQKKEQEAVHRAMTERLKLSQRIAGLASWEYLPQTDTHLWSPELYQTLGYAPGEIKLNMETMLKLSHPDDVAKVRECLKNVLYGTAEIYNVAHRVFKQDGTELVIHDHGLPERDENGNVVRIVGVSQDITNLALAEKNLAERNAYMRSLLATSSAGIASADTKGKLKYWNKAYEELTGYSGKELETLGNQATSHPDDLAEAAAVFARLKSGEIDEYRREKRYLHKDGRTIWADLSASAVRDKDGKLVEVIGVAVDITENKQAEAELRNREALLSAVLERSYDGLVTLRPIRDDEGKIVDLYCVSINDSAIEFLGQNLSNKAMLDVFPDSRKVGLMNNYIAAIESGEPFQAEHDFTGSLLGDPWLRVAGIPTGEGITIGLTDISEEKRAEEALRESERHHRSLLSHSNVGIASTTPMGRFVYWNETFQNLLGYSSAEIEKLSTFDVSHPDDSNETSDRFSRLIDGSLDSYQWQKRYRRKDGSTLWADVSVSAIRDSDGNTREVLGIVADITERMAAEATIREQAAIMEQMHESVITGDTEGVITGYNQGAEKLFGYTRNEILGQHFNILHPEEDLEFMHELMSGQLQKAGSAEIEIKLKKKSGELFDGQLLITLLRDRDGTPTGTVGYTLDITARKNAEAALKKSYFEMEGRVKERTRELQTELVQRRRTLAELGVAKEQAEEANQAKSEFLSRMSHELRTPMNAILGFSQLLQHDNKTPLTGSQPEFVGEIMSAGNHLMLLISQLLDMSKIETGNLELMISPLPPAPLVEECVTMTLSQAEERGITICNRIAGTDLIPIETDPLRFKQVLLNLLSNAVKYNRESGEIVIDHVDAKNGLVCFTVTDQGMGIPDDKLDSIFEPFNRAGAENFEVPGTGIGLAIAKQMVELMGGEIGVEDADGGGSKFWFTVPMASKQIREPM